MTTRAGKACEWGEGVDRVKEGVKRKNAITMPTKVFLFLETSHELEKPGGWSGRHGLSPKFSYEYSHH